jgi:predicted nucleic acid-binding protein
LLRLSLLPQREAQLNPVELLVRQAPREQQVVLQLEQLPPLPDDLRVKDPNDAFLLAMALSSEADYLVTGDRRAGLSEQRSMGRTRIVTPTVLCDQVL